MRVLGTFSLVTALGWESAVAWTTSSTFGRQQQQWKRHASSETTAVDGDPVNGESGSFDPKPPEVPPPSYQQNLQEDLKSLREQAEEKDATVQVLEKKMKGLKQELQIREAELKTSQQAWGLEKNSLLAKITEFSQMLQMRDEEETETEEDVIEKERLTKEVEILQTQIERVQNLLKQEQNASALLKARLDEVSDTMEMDQMDYEKEKKALTETVQEEKEKLAKLQNRWTQDKQRFEQEKLLMEADLAAETSKLVEAEEQWKETQKEYEQQRESLMKDLTEQRTRLSEKKKELDIDRTRFQTERASLKQDIASEQKKVAELEQSLDVERLKFRKSQVELNEKIKVEKDTVERLSQQLKDQETRFEEQKINLEVALEVEQTRLANMEKEFEQERRGFNKERQNLEARIAEEVRLRQLKKKQMHDRYEQIRKELTSLWVGAKREARKEQKKLTEKYEELLATAGDKIQSLEADLSSLRSSSLKLEEMLATTKKEKEKAVKETARVEAQYQKMVSERNQQIASLKADISALRDVAEERQDTVEKYESSYREAVGLVGRVTKNKVKRSRLSRWFRRNKEEPSEE